MTNPEPVPVPDPVLEQDDEDEGVQGDGKIKSSEGLYDDQIDKVMSKYKDFKDCIMKDQIKTLLPDIKPQSRVAFIINTQNSDKPGQHWQCIYRCAKWTRIK